ncbi:MAG: sigma-70 family RNA polymerase sigma factor, partial [Planctomycetaceae bacterium]|nr:sigma-70 family RNA polymerase sigma factor [Planctomycetaceae bacterium]
PEDAVQECLLRLMREQPLPDRPVAWMYRAVRRRALTAARSAQRRRSHEQAASRNHEWFEASLADVVDAKAAAAAVAQLPSEEREIVILKLWGGMSFAEVGDLVGCSASAAHRRFGAALNRLRIAMGETCPNSILSRPISRSSPPR